MRGVLLNERTAIGSDLEDYPTRNHHLGIRSRATLSGDETSFPQLARYRAGSVDTSAITTGSFGCVGCFPDSLSGGDVRDLAASNQFVGPQFLGGIATPRI